MSKRDYVIDESSFAGDYICIVEQVIGNPTQEQIDSAVAAYIEGHPGSISGLSEAAKVALLQLAEKVVYIDEHGQDYYDDLYDALYPPVELTGITAVYTQSGTIYTTDTLDSLKTNLVVTATYSDSSTAIVAANDYTLSGTLTAGTSTITASYEGETDSFDVTVTQAYQYVTSGLVHHWDAINNVGTGVHSSDTTTWKDLVGNVDIAKKGSETSTTWTADALYFNPTEMVYQNWDSSNAITYSATMTIEVCLEPTTNEAYPTGKSGCFANFYGSGKTAHRRFAMITTDNTVGVYFNESSSATYPVGESVLNMRSIVGLYTAQTGSSGCYVNGVSKTKSTSYKHTYGDDATRNFVRLGSYSSQSANAYHFLGKIHAIRIYSRVLTEAEILNNLAVDNQRFNLGLTL